MMPISHDMSKINNFFLLDIATTCLSKEEFGISSFIFRSDRPFHPARMLLLQSTGSDGILRSKGTVWVASSPQQSLVWGQAGVSVRIEAGPLWLHGRVEPSQWPEGLERYKSCPAGDRRQEVVFIGRKLKENEIRERLQEAFLTEEELKMEWPAGQTFPLGHLILRN